MKRKYMRISMLLAAAMTLTACGTMRETTEETEDTFRVAANPYLDTSDLKYVCQEEQNFATGASFEDPMDNNPVLIYHKYVSEDNETFWFDTNGRLCKYQNRYEVFNSKEDYLTSRSADTRQDAAALEDISGTVFEAVVQPDSEYEIVPCENLYFQIEDAKKDAAALVWLNEYGDVRSCSISYQTVSSRIDQAYFDAKINAYIDKKMAHYDTKENYAVNCTYDARYEQVGQKVYGIYTVTFEFKDGSFWCELVGFTKTVDEEATREE